MKDSPDFDRLINRRNTNSAKWDSSPPGYEGKDLLPMWVADMDFLAPEPVITSLQGIVDHGVFGYSRPLSELNDAYMSWVDERLGTRLEEQWLLQSGGVLKALAFAIQSLTEPGDKIIIQPPVYHPFPPLIERNGRVVAENPLVEDNGSYTIDLDQLDHTANSAKGLILCNPHNPVGRVFTREELEGVLEICSRRGLVVFSDEIHSDIIMPGFEHIPLYSVGEKYDVPMVVLTSTTKTFNLAGIHMGWIIVPDTGVREAMQKTLQAAHDGRFGYLPAVAALAAYRECGYWLDALLRYVDGNHAVLKQELEQVPGIRVFPLQGTYLAWVDFRNTGVRPERLKETMLGKAGVWLNAGETFGRGGGGFQRMNLATSRSRVLEACGRIKTAFS
jgi:cystathionine beta-lyase